jgi:uncharacterized membrane protein YbaN (DUF454 family)
MRSRSLLPPIVSVTPGLGGNVAPTREPGVLHSSYGRLRVHLPHWSGSGDAELAAEVQRVAGVTHAEASPITKNLLILFAPQQTSMHAILDALPGLPLEESWAPATDFSPQPLALKDPMALLSAEPHAYMTGTGRVLYQVLGWSSVGMAVVGAIVPGIPTAPFVVLAGYFFIRSSPEAHQWLRESRWFGPILRDWEEHRAIRRSLRNAAVGLILFSMGFTALLGLPTALTASIITLQLVGLAIVMSLPVVEASMEPGLVPDSGR